VADEKQLHCFGAQRGKVTDDVHDDGWHTNLGYFAE
jgi:hypothetical protein